MTTSTVLSSRVICSSSGDKRVPQLRKSTMMCIRQQDKRTDDSKIISNYITEFMKNKTTKRGQGPML